MLPRIVAVVMALATLHGFQDAPRLRQVAQDIWDASGTVQAFCGPAAREATAWALVSIGDHESGWDPRVQNCTWPRGNPADSLWQLEGIVARDGHTRAEVCSDNALAAQLAAKALGRFKRCGDLGCMFRGYASGNTATQSKAARELESAFALRISREGFTVSYVNGCLTARLKGNP